MQMDDKELVRLVLLGDHEAYGRLYDRYASVIRAICFDSTANLEHAQDLAQETFLRAYRKLRTLRDPERFAAWLVSIARRVIQEALRKRVRDGRVRVGIPPEALAVDAVGESQAAESLHRALAQLTEKQRLALHLFHLQGKSAADAQRVLDLSSSGFYKLLSQAQRRLSEIIAKGE
jgi:RNA polymerase sigma-70 factor (ECF subfamily)